MKLTKRVIDSLNEPGFYSDEELPGFRLRVSVGKGKLCKAYQVFARLKGSTKVVFCTIGKHGAPWTPEQARDEAKRLLREIKLGNNPNVNAKEKAARQEVALRELDALKRGNQLTLRLALQEYLDFKKTKMSSSTVETYLLTTGKYLSDWLDKPLKAITREMVSTKYANTSSKSVASVNNAFRVLRAIFNFYIEKEPGLLESNPVKVLSALEQWESLKAKSDVITDIHLKKWWQAVEGLKSKDHADYFHLLLLTGFRKKELSGVKWSDIDFAGLTWTVRDTKNHSDHVLPITKYVEQILRRRLASRSLGDKLLFPNIGYGNYLRGVPEAQKLVVSMCQVEFTPHTLRRTFGTNAAMLLPDYLVKRFLNHHNAQDVTQNHYVKMNEIRTLMEPLQRVEDELLRKCSILSSDYSRSASMLRGSIG